MCKHDCRFGKYEICGGVYRKDQQRDKNPRTQKERDLLVTLMASRLRRALYIIARRHTPSPLFSVLRRLLGFFQCASLFIDLEQSIWSGLFPPMQYATFTPRFDFKLGMNLGLDGTRSKLELDFQIVHARSVVNISRRWSYVASGQGSEPARDAAAHLRSASICRWSF